MLDDRLTGIETFLRAAESESFSAAAVKMNVTRSAVAKAVARLEARLGVRLFHRTTREHALTEEGARYYEQCSRVVDDLTAIETALRGERGAIEGRLRLTAPVLFGRYCVAPVLRSLARTHPGLEFDVEFSDRVVSLSSEGFDMAVRIGPVAESAVLVARTVGYQRMAIFGSPSYLASNGRPDNMVELKEHFGIMYARGLQVVPWRLMDSDGSTHEVVPRHRERYDDLQVIVDSAVEGAGLVWLPCWLAAPYVASGQLSLVMDSDRVRSSGIHAVWPRTRYMPQKLRVLIDALARTIPDADGIHPLCLYPLVTRTERVS